MMRGRYFKDYCKDKKCYTAYVEWFAIKMREPINAKNKWLKRAFGKHNGLSTSYNIKVKKNVYNYLFICSFCFSVEKTQSSNSLESTYIKQSKIYFKEMIPAMTGENLKHSHSF